jgi:hypothetical protein
LLSICSPPRYFLNLFSQKQTLWEALVFSQLYALIELPDSIGRTLVSVLHFTETDAQIEGLEQLLGIWGGGGVRGVREGVLSWTQTDALNVVGVIIVGM